MKSLNVKMKVVNLFAVIAVVPLFFASELTADSLKSEDVPDLLTTFDGRKVVTSAQWETIRAPELLKELQNEEYGRRPVERPANLVFSAEAPDSEILDGKAVLKRIRVKYTGRYGKGGFSFMAVIPDVGRPVPSFVLFCTENQRTKHIDISKPVSDGFWPVEEIVSRGYAAIVFSNGEIAPDRRGAGMTGVFCTALGALARQANV